MRYVTVLVLFLLSLTSFAYGADWFYRPLGFTEAGNVAQHNWICNPTRRPGIVCDGRTYDTAWRLSPARLGIENNFGAMDVSQMSPGDRLFICGHHYRSFNRLVQIAGVHDITITAECPGDPGVLEWGSLSVRDSSKVVIEDIVIDKSRGSGLAVINSTDVVVQNSTVNHARFGILVNGRVNGVSLPSRNVILRNNTITNVHEGILMGAYSGDPHVNVFVLNNRIQNVGPPHFEDTSISRADYEAIGAQGARGLFIRGNTILNSVYAVNFWTCAGKAENIFIEDNVINNTFGGPSSWPSRAIFRSCFRNIPGHDNQHIRRNTVVNSEHDDIRWACATDAINCLIEGNTVVNEPSIVTSGSVEVGENVIVP